ncbi:3-dehydroquinate synthase [Adhaeribacter pallidiroseus]|uniref:3-dehydroquinate synthase n=1 Tax=Adhaeribacter pallidiroseus TaxID=2072847 RepID=A0A369QGJ0_9BACT|nr:3-dehydroquinate synthase [Adhaeribacter pallidiroseus]RDC62387.1 3-dehydroquinate synthase [Adhaeribacter pallidiroseus]
MLENIHIGLDVREQLQEFLKNRAFDKIAVLVDENTAALCYPLLRPYLPEHTLITIKSGEEQKTLATCEHVWQQLTDIQASRWSVLVNVGGGVIGDLGGFCAGVFKRGIYFVQVPTTLLAQVDASVGGKTGVDFNGLKNHLGVFQEPLKVFIYPEFLKTLSEREVKSGYAEIIKHWLIAEAASFEEQRYIGLMTEDWTKLIEDSVAVKARVVANDPRENGLRKILNFGHTIGHAVETYLLAQPQRKLLHGEAIAVGMLCESYLSVRKGLLTQSDLSKIETFLFSVYEKVNMAAREYAAIARLALQDKKNTGSTINCTLLAAIGEAVYDQPITLAEIEVALKYYHSL